MQIISPEEYKRLKSDGTSFVEIDVRNRSEWDIWKNDDALLIPLPILFARFSEFLRDKNKKILCCCEHGVRARQAASFLENEGYTDIMVLDGGYTDYRESI